MTNENISTSLSSDLTRIADEIIKVEKGRNSWTLMHRFNLCHDFLDQAQGPDGLALLFVWLRFSALRQLDWQRNYNTKPRELSHAQQRLTFKLASLYQTQSPEGKEIIRLIFSTLGRGAEGGRGQQIRDDILHIMHRHHVKEVSGHFLEEWHQKLHNNTTPDDIVICEAYLEFLRSNGDLNLFYQTLEQGGVTRERLRGFERPIVSDPQFVPHIKDGLIYDFENYLKLLRSIHSATDLASAIDEAGRCLDGELSEKAYRLYNSRDDSTITLFDRVKAITELRTSLRDALDRSNADDCRRDILYLDIALEDFLRTIVERDIHKKPSPDLLVDLIEMLTENVGLYHPNPELGPCLDLLRNLKRKETASPEDRALHFIAVNERINNILASFADYYTELLQAKAEYLGAGFEAEDWVIDLFSQEIIRGGSAFVLSILLSRTDPALRLKAGLGSWQIISRGEAAGRLKVGNLQEFQNTGLDEPTVLVSYRISGDEEVIDNLAGVVTSSSVDVLSHVAVRARNAGVFFASCHERNDIEALGKLEGRPVALSIDSSGDVVFAERKGTEDREEKKTFPAAGSRRTMKPGKTEFLAVDMDDFEPGIVGGKAHQLKILRKILPDWIKTPASAAIPFGVCEKVIDLEENRNLKREYEKLVAEVERAPSEILPEIRGIIKKLTLPDDLLDDLKKAMAKQDLPFPDDIETVKERIKQIWASKWNDRAYYSRRKWRMSHQDLVMSVLVQETIPAEYAFVLHTVNPFTGRDDELYGEIVVGLGETLCSGNYQGRALSFTCKKGEGAEPRLQFYPSKGEALFGGGLIFRSDSNGEDLEDYAGAGLYDSFTLEPPEGKIIDYNKVDLLWNEKSRDDFFKKLTEIGIEVEKAMNGKPQDIEGAYAKGAFHVVQTRAQVGVDVKTSEIELDETRPDKEKLDSPPEEKAFRIGNQTSYAAARYSDPFDFAIENNFDAFEWFPDKKEDGSGWDISELSRRQIEAIRARAAENDILLSVHAPWWANPLEEAATELLLHNIEFAKAVGAKVFNIHFHAGHGLDLFLEKLEPVILAARDADLKLAIENTPETTPEDCNTFFSLLNEKDIPSRHVGLCFDLGHANLCASSRNDYVGYLKTLQPHVPIIHVHFHENFGEADSHMPLFTGPAKDNPEGLRLVMEFLGKRGFKGAIILEQWPEPRSLLLEAKKRLLELCPRTPDGSSEPAPREPEPIKKKAVKKGSSLNTLDRDTAAFVSLDRENGSWREKLAALNELLEKETWHYSLHQLVLLAIYLRFLGTGQIICKEDGRHFRPSHHAKLSERIFNKLITHTENRHKFVLRKIIPWLPSFAAPFKRSEPLTRIRDIAHRNDIPNDLKKEIKHTLQNKLHRCAGPEDLRTAEKILGRITAEEGRYSPDFVRDFKVFYGELREFFNARSLDFQLSSLMEKDKDLAGPAELLLQAKNTSGRSTAALLNRFDLLTELRGLVREKIGTSIDPTLYFRLLLVDVTLEDYAFVIASDLINLLEKKEKKTSAFMPDSLALAKMLAENIGLSGLEPWECEAVSHELASLRESGKTGGRDFLLRVKACLERAERISETYGSKVAQLLTERAEELGGALGLPEHVMINYTEGDIRGNPVFHMSKTAGQVIHQINRTLKINAQDVLVPGTASGVVVRADQMPEVEDRGAPVILLLDRATGDEFIPGPVKGIILLHDLPHLSHLAIRARQQGVVLAASPEKALDFNPRKTAGGEMTLSADYSGFNLIPGKKKKRDRTTNAVEGAALITSTPFSGKYTVNLNDITTENAGAKADGVRKLLRLSMEGEAPFTVPGGLAVPFGVMEKVIDDAGLGKRYEQLIDILNRAGDDLPKIIIKIKKLIGSLKLPPEIGMAAERHFSGGALIMVRSSANCEDLEEMAGAGLYDSVADVSLDNLEDAVRRVWASLWNHRAVISRKQAGIPHQQARMAVLLQPCLDPDYCFVLHTVNPLTQEHNEIYAEIAAGQGEVLASGLMRGTPYRIKINKKNGSSAMLSFANYSISPRSGKNQVNDYARIAFTTDEAFRKRLIKDLARVAKAVEKSFGRAQDIEGAILGENIHLVQARPQVGIKQR